VTHGKFQNRYNFLRAQLKGFVLLLATGTLLITTMVSIFPRLPPLIYSLYDKSEENILLRGILCLFEAYIFPMGTSTLFASNVLLFMTYRNLGGCTAALNEILKQRKTFDLKTIEATTRKYQYLQILIDRLDSAFSASLLYQEFAILMAIALTIFGPSKIASENSAVLTIFFYLLATEFACSLIFQFYPMIVLNLNSKKFIYLSRSVMLESRHSRAIVEKCRELKIRPMGVHTITPHTLNDYVVFVVSFLLMLRKAWISVKYLRHSKVFKVIRFGIDLSCNMLYVVFIC